MLLTTLLALLMACQLDTAASSMRHMENQLLADILANHSRSIKPQGLNSETFKVEFSAGLVQLIDIDEKNQIVDGFYYTVTEWRDEELTWNPADYGGLYLLAPPDGSIWMPDVSILNDVDPVMSRNSMTTLFFYIQFDGTVTYMALAKYRSSCSLNLMNFPFDKQNCTLMFTSWRHHASDLNLTIMDTEKRDSLIDQFAVRIENSEFGIAAVTSTSVLDDVCCMVPMIQLHYHLIFKRRPLFYLFNMLLPCTLITFVAMLAFCIPPESGEKIGLGVTVLLSLSVFLLILSDQMPPATEIPLIGVYFFGVVILVTSSTGFSILTSRIHMNSAYKVKRLPKMAKTVLKYLPKWLCMTPSEDIEYSMENNMEEHGYAQENSEMAKRSSSKSKVGNYEEPAKPASQLGDHTPVIEMSEDKDLSTIAQFLRNQENNQKQAEYLENIAEQWRQLSIVIDRCLFIIFILIKAIFTTWVILQAALN